MPEKAHDVVIWCDGRHAALGGRVLGLVPELRVAALGGPRKGQLADLADELGVKVEDDLRKVLIEHPPRFLFLATTEAVGPQEIKQAAAVNTAIVTLEPAFDIEPDG